MNDFVYMICVGYFFGISVMEAAHGLNKIIGNSGDIMDMHEGRDIEDPHRRVYGEDLY